MILAKDNSSCSSAVPRDFFQVERRLVSLVFLLCSTNDETNMDNLTEDNLFPETTVRLNLLSWRCGKVYALFKVLLPCVTIWHDE